MDVVIQCPVCDAQATQGMDRFEVPVGARRVTVSAERMRCHQCGEAFLTPDQMDAAQVAASNQIRREEGLLLPEEIRAIRYTFGLSQTALEQLLSAGAKTVVRWERGTVFQNKTTDELLRLVRDVPGVFEHLALRRGLMPAELAEPSPAQSIAGAPAVYAAEVIAAEDPSGVIDINKWPRGRQRGRRVEPNAEVSPLPQEAIQ